jgi:hypothetical protein
VLISPYLEIYRVIIENYPTNLITEDRWGALPLMYAFWGAAPAEIIQFLIESYQSLYPGYEFTWTIMVRTMGRCDTPKECIDVKKTYFPEQIINWEYLLDDFHCLHVSLFYQLSQKGCNFYSYAACQSVWKILPLKFGVTTSQT